VGWTRHAMLDTETEEWIDDLSHLAVLVPGKIAVTIGYQAEMKHFVECVREGRQPRETYEDGYVVNSILDAAYRSMRSRKWVRVKME
jgi:predicted dehydrogenase